MHDPEGAAAESRARPWGDKRQEPVVPEDPESELPELELPEEELPDPDEPPEWWHPFAMDGGAPLDAPGAPDEPVEPDEADEPDEPVFPDEPFVDVDDPVVDDDSTADVPVVAGLALVDAPAKDMPSPKLSPKAPRAVPTARMGRLSFMVISFRGFT